MSQRGGACRWEQEQEERLWAGWGGRGGAIGKATGGRAWRAQRQPCVYLPSPLLHPLASQHACYYLCPTPPPPWTVPACRVHAGGGAPDLGPLAAGTPTPRPCLCWMPRTACPPAPNLRRDRREVVGEGPNSCQQMMFVQAGRAATDCEARRHAGAGCHTAPGTDLPAASGSCKPARCRPGP